MRDEALGWTRDLPLYVHQALPWLVDQRTRLITNAGGINPGTWSTRLPTRPPRPALERMRTRKGGGDRLKLLNCVAAASSLTSPSEFLSRVFGVSQEPPHREDREMRYLGGNHQSPCPLLDIRGTFGRLLSWGTGPS